MSSPRPDLPADALVLLVGPSGAGKSTWAARHFRADEILSSDRFREMVAADATDQSATADAFKVLHTIARARMRRGLLTVVDATNLTEAARRSLLRLAGSARRPTAAIVFDLSLERCLEQNAARLERQVPEAVVRRQHRQLRSAIERLPGEGYAAIHRLHDSDIAEG